MSPLDRLRQTSACPASTGAALRWFALLVLLVLFLQLLSGVKLKSPTMDEQNHLARGLAYLRTRDLRLSQEHPPGVNVWAAWPVTLDRRVELPLDDPTWARAEWYGFADRLLWRVNDRPQQMIFAGRVPIMWLTLILAALVYRWAREIGGRWAGIGALMLCAFDPNLLAHGRLVTNDVGVACLSLAAMWAFWRALREPSAGRWIGAGVALGAAQLAKFSALVLIPVVLCAALLWIVRACRRGTCRWSVYGRWTLRLALCFVVCGVVIWAGYGFTWGEMGFLNRVPGPAPMYGAGIEAILRRTGGGTRAFLMGRYSSSGWWYYFPVAFAIKTPLPTLIAIVVAVSGALAGRGPLGVFSARGRTGSGDRAAAVICLVLPPLAFWGIAVAGSFNIGYRHLLPSLPFVYVLVSWQISLLIEMWLRQEPVRCGRIGIVVGGAALLACWLVVEAAAVAPHYLAYFNQIAGGPSGGYRFLVDSNLDWGQDLPGLVRYAQKANVGRIYLGWFGAAHPEAYDLAFHPLPGFWRFGGEPAEYGLNRYAPGPGIYAISASNVQGVAFEDHDIYAWFRSQTPIDRIGYSILIYEVEVGQQERDTVILGVPEHDLSGPGRSLLRGGASVRRFDPASGLIVPQSARSWYIVPEPLPWGEVSGAGDGYVVLQGEPLVADHRDVFAQFDAFVELAHYRIDPRAGMLQVQAEWVVTAPPHRTAISFAHLLDDGGRYVAGWDGSTAPATCWQEEDRILQVYSIPMPDDVSAGSYQVEVGWYDAQTLERWPCSVAGTGAGDRFLIGPVELEP